LAPRVLTIIPHVPKVIYIFRRTNGRHEKEKGLDAKGCAVGIKKNNVIDTRRGVSELGEKNKKQRQQRRHRPQRLKINALITVGKQNWNTVLGVCSDQFPCRKGTGFQDRVSERDCSRTMYICNILYVMYICTYDK